MANRIIKVLTKEVATKIAAGEVVERPLSVVKELVENAIDAGSTAITVEIKAGGKDSIRVSDNGCGIERIQLPLAFKRYATSKIETEEDLNTIQTLGFRGEALASIAAVSKVTLTTKTEAANVGSCIHINANQIKSIEDAACEQGTTIIVKNLFYNVPVRLKFLKADNIEGSLIIDFVSKVAIAYPNIAFRLISNGSILFATNGKYDLLNAIGIVYGPDIARNLIPVAFDDGIYQLKGYVSSPTVNKTNKHWETFFVNGRVVKSKLLEDSLSSAYRDKLFKDQFPISFLFLQVPFDGLDVNIHPHKTEVRFFNEEDIKEFIVQSIRMALLNPNALNVTKFTKAEADLAVVKKNISETVYKNEVNENKIEEEEVSAKELTQEIEESVNKPILEPQTEVKPETVINVQPEKANSDVFKTAEVEKTVEVQEEVFKYNDKPVFRFLALKYLNQIFDTYLLCQDNSNLYIIDQHAAHERVMYEKLLERFNSEENASQQVLTPIVIDLTHAQKEASIESIDILEQMGFEFEEFGPTSYNFKAIPSCMNMEESENFLYEFFEAAEEHSGNIQAKRDTIVSRACKSAVKAHDKLSEKEVLKLLADLDLCQNPFSCPHGRPTFLKFTKTEIERMFKRK